MRPILIVKVGSAASVIGADKPDFEDWFIEGLDVGPELVRVCVPNDGEALPDPSEISGVVVTGSSAMVTDKAEWSERTAVWLRAVVTAQVPVFGICYGHQLLAYALGGVVGDNPNGREIGTVDIHLNDLGKQDALLGGLPTHFLAQASHSQSVLKLPEGAHVLASNKMDEHHAFSFGSCVWGVQFHPEFGTEYIHALIGDREAMIRSEGIDVEMLRSQVRETPLAYGLLKRFAQHVKALAK